MSTPKPGAYGAAIEFNDATGTSTVTSDHFSYATDAVNVPNGGNADVTKGTFTKNETAMNAVAALKSKISFTGNAFSGNTTSINGVSTWSTITATPFHCTFVPLITATDNSYAEPGTNAKLHNSSVTATKLHNGAVTTSKLRNNAVSTSKLANNAVGTTKLADQSVTTSKIADGAVTATQVAPFTFLAQNGTAVNAVGSAGCFRPTSSRAWASWRTTGRSWARVRVSSFSQPGSERSPETASPRGR